VLASDGAGGFDRKLLFGSTAIQYVGWVAGTIAGVLGGGLLDDAERYGLDAVYPAFFLALLIEELRGGRSPVAAVLGGLIALVLIPIAPPGVPVLAASLGALWGLRR
jgi:predicted branched-subunit amino acid permease